MCWHAIIPRFAIFAALFFACVFESNAEIHKVRVGQPVCKEYMLLAQDKTMTSFSAEIGVPLKDLKALNKKLKKHVIYPSGSSICVYGSRKMKNPGIEMMYGRRSDHLYEYRTIKGTDTCTTLFEYFKSYEYFVAANPNIRCESLDTESSTVYLSNAIIGDNGEEASINWEDSKKVRYGAWSSWSKCDSGRRSRYRHVYGSPSDLSSINSSSYEESKKMRT